MKIVIQYHLASGNSTGYDVFVKKSIFVTKKKIEKLKSELDFYDVGCSHVEQFLLKNPNFIFIGSEDTNHIEIFNSQIIDLIQSLRFEKQALFIPAGFEGNLEL